MKYIRVDSEMGNQLRVLHVYSWRNQAACPGSRGWEVVELNCKRASWGQSGGLREAECGPDPSAMGQWSQLLAPHENGYLLKSFLPSFSHSTTAS